MTELIVNSYFGTVSLFLLDAHMLQSNHIVNESEVVSVAAPYGFNHHNVALEAIIEKKHYDFSLKDLYVLDINTHLDKRRIDTISDLLTSPLIAALYSVEAMPVRMEDDTNPYLHDIVKDEPIEGYTAIAPRISLRDDLHMDSSTASKSNRSPVKKKRKSQAESATNGNQGKLIIDVLSCKFNLVIFISYRHSETFLIRNQQ